MQKCTASSSSAGSWASNTSYGPSYEWCTFKRLCLLTPRPRKMLGVLGAPLAVTGEYNFNLFPKVPVNKYVPRFATSGVMLLFKRIGNKSAQAKGRKTLGKRTLIEKMLTPCEGILSGLRPRPRDGIQETRFEVTWAIGQTHLLESLDVECWMLSAEY